MAFQIHIGGTRIENQPCGLPVHLRIQIDVIGNKLKTVFLSVEESTQKQNKES